MCKVITTHTEQVRRTSDPQYKLVFLCVECTQAMPEG
jgi:hypothetical protein